MKSNAVLLLIGTLIGVTGKAGLDAALSSAQAASAAPVAHAVDLRRDYSGENFKFAVYANRSLGDAGYADLGQAKNCRPLSTQTQKQLVECMNVVSAVCEW